MTKRSGRVLWVDDERDLLSMSSQVLRREGLTVETTTSARDGLNRLATETFDVVLLDMKMPDMGGMEFLAKYSEQGVRAEVVVLTAHGSMESAVSAMRLGAYGYVRKPFDPEEVLSEIDKALEVRALRSENVSLRVARSGADQIIGEHDSMRELHRLIREVAPTHMPVLVRGETGTGKELVARAIHGFSRRAEKPLLSCNCAAFATGLLESELFGHVRGSYTGATSDRKGRFEEADGGTLLLDEVGDLNPEAQIRLLRVLQEHTIERVGATQSYEVDVRIVSATHRDLETEIAEGRFREDLYYRLNGITLTVPPLRTRKSDLPLLCRHLIQRSNKSMGRQVASLSNDAISAIARYDWPGNVRELENVLSRAVALCRREFIEVDDLRLGAGAVNANARQTETYEVEAGDFNNSREEFERQYIERALAQMKGNISQTAELIKVDRRQLQRKMHALGIDAK